METRRRCIFFILIFIKHPMQSIWEVKKKLKNVRQDGIFIPEWLLREDQKPNKEKKKIYKTLKL